jgi:hypothetical protein
MGSVWWKRSARLTREELNGLIAIFMRMEANVARIALEVAGEDHGEETE